MGSELHAGSLAMHWFLVLNFKRFPKYASMNLSWYFPGNSNGLGYSNPSEDQSPLLCAAISGLLLPRAQSRAAPLGSQTVPEPAEERALPPRKAAARSTRISGTSTAQEQSYGEGHKHRVRMRDPRKDTEQKLRWCPFLWHYEARPRAPATQLPASLGRSHLTT